MTEHNAPRLDMSTNWTPVDRIVCERVPEALRSAGHEREADELDGLGGRPARPPKPPQRRELGDLEKRHDGAARLGVGELVEAGDGRGLRLV